MKKLLTTALVLACSVLATVELHGPQPAAAGDARAFAHDGIARGATQMQSHSYRVPPSRTEAPRSVYASPGQGYFPETATNADGRAIVVWQSRTHLLARFVSPAGRLGSVLSISSARGDQPAVADVVIDTAGVATIVWSTQGVPRLLLRRVTPSGKVGPVEVLLDDDGGSPGGFDVATDRTRRVVVTWEGVTDPETYNQALQARMYSPSGEPGETLTLAEPTEGPSFPALGMDGAGNAVVTWFSHEADAARARPVSSSGALGPVVTVTSGRSLFPEIAVDSDGNSLVTWSSRGTVKLRSVSASGKLGSALTISRRSAGAPSAPQVAINAAGHAVISWYAGRNGKYDLYARTRSGSGQLGPVRKLTERGASDTLTFEVAVSPSGGATVVWAPYFLRAGKVETRVLSRKSRLGPVRTLSRRGVNPDLGLAGNDIAIVWTDSSNKRVAFAR